MKEADKRKVRVYIQVKNWRKWLTIKNKSGWVNDQLDKLK